MKIGILTYHCVVNDGSALQAYCLQKLVERHLPEAHVEIIDYHPAALKKAYRWSWLNTRPPFVDLQLWRKQRSLQAFQAKYCTLSKSTCVSDELKEVQKFIRQQNYDAVVVGSDTVWELQREDGMIPPPPNIYVLPGIEEVRKAAFSVSADPFNQTASMSKSLCEKLRYSISDFDFISLRDAPTHDFVVKLGIKAERLCFMPDPTLLWDFSDLVERPDGLSKRPGEKLAGVAVGSSTIRRQATQQLIDEGFRVINLLGLTEGDAQPLPAAPSLSERLGVYPCLDFMVTDRFHGSILTLKLGNAPVIFVEEPNKWPQPMSKGRDLFGRLGLGQMVFRPNTGEIPPHLVCSRMAAWSREGPEIAVRLAALQEAAQDPLERLQRSLSESATV